MISTTLIAHVPSTWLLRVRTQTLAKHLGMLTKHFLLTLTSGMSTFRYNTLQSVTKKAKKTWRRSLELGGLVPQHNNTRSLEMTRRG